ncbi:PREDICTED: uncharacterized protein LOC107072913 [Polistes dominula]|uniref:Uncharacterized protein LOC107072913 n=1 Tax=Polistes dominula TaxID=743375 RepID=A0ABM1J8C7_POLDO|nr:PREDICTED: uncharacterized protein LOC107072913 [Polistes dominula]
MQRNALTREKQQRLSTGGGPAVMDAEIDPDATIIAPNVMKTAPTLFSSNMLEEEVEVTRDSINKTERLEELLNNNNDSLEDVQTEENSSEPSTSRGIKRPLRETSKSSKKFRNENINSEENNLRLYRLHRIIHHKKQLFSLKFKNEQEMHDLTISRMRRKFKLEIRAAKAAAELAELKLRKEHNKDSNNDL